MRSVVFVSTMLSWWTYDAVTAMCFGILSRQSIIELCVCPLMSLMWAAAGTEDVTVYINFLVKLACWSYRWEPKWDSKLSHKSNIEEVVG